MKTSLLHLLLSPGGRLRRRTFWTSLGLASVALAGSWWILDITFGSTATWFVHLPFLWIAAVLMIKRLHDRGRSGWWLLLLLIPLLGPLWLALELVFLGGSAGPNRYGANPRGRADYLTVR
ncbi:DUF805 domain-containing protein [Tahibacter amnicola]|uniref:DUF805 domain-containing protein n=1 Tax=Tahibacter amnicola TaxID=2976241 RepID=A0ABY6BG60_9GAMM|nr:DUF805 domain-containing protein [Tahibacter amnicola]UXI68820.1 DUF805 domain-containing protein [Tahibacter amnicola]